MLTNESYLHHIMIVATYMAFFSTCVYLSIDYYPVSTALLYLPIIPIVLSGSHKYALAMILIAIHSCIHIFISNSMHALLYKSTLDIFMHEVLFIYTDYYYCSSWRKNKFFEFWFKILHLGNIVCFFMSIPYFTSYNIVLFTFTSMAPSATSALFMGVLLTGPYKGNLTMALILLYTAIMYLWMTLDEDNVTLLVNLRFFEGYFACACTIGWLSELSYNKKQL